ncbi:DUF4982 domain-containing protein [Segetibacter sp. 3557_3]|uniref:beta-galactosidase GalB n=1 Tax=Segetibacter sp. 3557_3 TaxID=2547429 RepID=UPI001058F7DA|nr:beta-galactosidase GalB [Segetibacter sp. 3557_3]TDH26472.1 DUF4982 domain-containing protein [Segetibacter sp. 3557_3]
MTRLLLIAFVVAAFCMHNCFAQQGSRQIQNFNKTWQFYYADTVDKNDQYKDAGFNSGAWRTLNLPHDWSIEGAFDRRNPATPEGGALPGGIGWYRKRFNLPATSKGKLVSIEFDGVYQRSEVWINDHYLGLRPNGYISFSYDLTPYLKFGEPNVIAVKVDNSKQPNSRWYSGSGIYRNVRLITTSPVAVQQWGTFVSTPVVNKGLATVVVQTSLKSAGAGSVGFIVETIIRNATGKEVTRKTEQGRMSAKGAVSFPETFSIKSPELWSVERPYNYTVLTRVLVNGKLVDDYVTPFGIRYFDFNVDKGFSLNGKPMKLLGVCNHHDLGALGAAVNTRALERQLEILKTMGVNAIRTSHNPPAPELLDLCDRMGFVVMDEAFDVWRRRKMRYDYHLYFDEWHERDLADQVKRDRNHPSVMMWSIGNEIPEQADSSAGVLAQKLAGIIRALDTTRPITAANNNPDVRNKIIQSGAIDLTGYNYHHNEYAKFHERYPGRIFIGTETTSALQIRGFYQMPSDSIMRWPENRPASGPRTPAAMNPDYMVSAYDNVSAPWGSTHEETWKVIKQHDFLSGLFIWTGFDYLGEPTPYSWPARSSYFGIIDLAGFPKDVYYMYQGEWTNKNVLHIFPHWNWKEGELVDVWAYYNNADEVELFLNGKSLGVKQKQGNDLHIMWRVPFTPGTLKAVSRKGGAVVLSREISTAGAPAKIELTADRKSIKADGTDLSFVKVRILDASGNLVPHADNLVQFELKGEATIAGVDNGNPVSHESFKANSRKAFHGLALLIIQAKETRGSVTVRASSAGLSDAALQIQLK